jgi:L-arabinokinase
VAAASVVFYISGHGFGHASRQVEVINALGARCPGLRIVIRSSVSPELLARTVRVPYELRPGPCDSGIIQSSSIAHDDAATVEAAIGFYSTFDDRVRAEVQALHDEPIQLIVGDIPPLAFEVAHRLRLPSVAIANFTWDWIYETHPGMTTAAPWLLARIRQAYARATLALELPFSGGLEVFPTVRGLPLIARHRTRTREETRAHCGLPLDRPVVLLSFGGYGLPRLDLASLDCLGEWTVATTDRVVAPAASWPSGIVFLEEERFVSTGFRYEDLVAAVDVVATKPGYGILAECLANGTAMLYTSRGHFREYDRMVRDMPRYLSARFISQEDLFAGRWRHALNALRRQSAPSDHLDSDGAERAVDELVRLVHVNT